MHKQRAPHWLGPFRRPWTRPRALLSLGMVAAGLAIESLDLLGHWLDSAGHSIIVSDLVDGFGKCWSSWSCSMDVEGPISQYPVWRIKNGYDYIYVYIYIL